MIARSQRHDPRLLQPEVSSTTLPARLIDVGLDNTQSPRVVDTAGQTGIYVALSYCWRSRGSLEKQLTTANMSRLRRSIEPSKTRRCVSDAIELTRSLGVRYIWIDSLCVVQDNQDECLNAMSRMSDIYRSAVLVIATVDTNDEAVDSCIDSSVLEQPFSIFLDWSRPTVAKSFSDCLFTPNNFSRHWAIPETFESKMSLLFSTYFWGKQAARDSAVATRINESDKQCEGITDSDPKHDVEAIQLEVETTDTRFDEANREIEQGVHHVEAGNTFEALALFMKAREFVSAFQLLSPRSWKIHAVASANIASIYQMQQLPVIALDIAKGSMAVKTKLPNENCKSALE